MRVSEIELRIRCNIALKELRKRGCKFNYSLNKMNRKQLTGLWGSLKQELGSIL